MDTKKEHRVVYLVIAYDNISKLLVSFREHKTEKQNL